MNAKKRKKCRHCKKLFKPDPRNRDRQNYCLAPLCRKAAKKASQQKWLQKPENKDYFRGPENTRRVQEWRKRHPEYRHKKTAVLQDPLIAEPVKNIEDSHEFARRALQDLITAQPFVLIGLIANFTGSALQDDIAGTLLRLQQLGRDIWHPATIEKGGNHVRKSTDPAPQGQNHPEKLRVRRPSPGPGPPH